MIMELFLVLLLAHLLSDFAFQTSNTCASKARKHERSIHQYIHAGVVTGLTWLMVLDLDFWWCALVIGASHLVIDIWKSYREDEVKWFLLDQTMHLTLIAGVAWLWCLNQEWTLPFGIELQYVVAALAAIVCWKPANIFIKLMLKQYSVNMPEEQDSGFNAGALIGTIERWLILIFVCLQRYDALGLLIAAKSIIRFSEAQNKKSEYVLAGTLLSIFIAVLAGMAWLVVHNEYA